MASQIRRNKRSTARTRRNARQTATHLLHHGPGTRDDRLRAAVDALEAAAGVERVLIEIFVSGLDIDRAYDLGA